VKMSEKINRELWDKCEKIFKDLRLMPPSVNEKEVFVFGYELAQKEATFQYQAIRDFEINGLKDKIKELEEQLREVINEFKSCYKALEFFEKHADCRTNKVYHCNCSFCKDREHHVLKINARAYLEKWKEKERE
jgi:hypothetical protein